MNLKHLFYLALLICPACQQGGQTENEEPNIIFILADDLGFDYAYGILHPWIYRPMFMLKMRCPDVFQQNTQLIQESIPGGGMD
jgi:hypothetical protein